MRTLTFAALAGFTILSACDGTNPFQEPVVDPGPAVGGVELPPGQVAPARISRYEARNDNGGGFAQQIAYDSTADTFTVDNLAFDGLNTYNRSPVAALANLGGYNVFEADVLVPDFLTGLPVGQISPYRAIYGESTNTVTVGGVVKPRSNFAIVRTGGYTNYGFGGFVYARNGTVVLPAENFSGQAAFTGRYAGMRVFNGRGGLEFTDGDMQIAIDFEDFNANDAVSGVVYNRRAFDVNGNPILVGNNAAAGELPLPDLTFVILEGVQNFNSNGEIAGNVTSTWSVPGGAPQAYETGVYYGIISGNLTNAGDGGEIVGVMVFESQDPRPGFEAQAQETGGFIVYR